MLPVAAGKGSSNRSIKYRCSNCGAEPGRDKLTVKRVQFATMGEKYRTLRSRTVAWLCDACREVDPAWNAPELGGLSLSERTDDA